MKVLVAEDDRSTLRLLTRILESFDFDVVGASDGTEALRLFLDEEPDIVVTDWIMPEMDGLTVTKTIRAFSETRYTYIIMISSRGDASDVLEGLQAGVDDFLTKPVDKTHLKARVRTARRIIDLQKNLRKKIEKLEEAHREVATLQGFLPICAYCKNIREDENLWTKIEHYIVEHQEDVEFSHSICPDCYEKHVKPMQDEFFAKAKAAVE